MLDACPARLRLNRASASSGSARRPSTTRSASPAKSPAQRLERARDNDYGHQGTDVVRRPGLAKHDARNRDHRDISHGDEAGYNVTIQEFTFPFFRNLAPGELEQVPPTPTVYATGTFDYRW